MAGGKVMDQKAVNATAERVIELLKEDEGLSVEGGSLLGTVKERVAKPEDKRTPAEKRVLLMFPTNGGTTPLPVGRYVFDFERGFVLLPNRTRALFNGRLDRVGAKNAAAILVESDHDIIIITREKVRYGVRAGRSVVFTNTFTNQIVIDFAATTTFKIWATNDVKMLGIPVHQTIRVNETSSIRPFEATAVIPAIPGVVAIDLETAFGGVPPDFISILMTGISQLEYMHTFDRAWRIYGPGLAAGVAVNVNEESWAQIRITPVAPPQTYFVTASLS